MNLTIQKNDSKAKYLIWIFSVVIFFAVTALERVTLNVNLGFNPHVFAMINAAINSAVALLLIAGLYTAKQKLLKTHRKIMLTAIVLSIFFLVSYILHHLFAGSTLYGDSDHNGIVDAIEKSAVGNMRYVYFFLLGTHILMAGVSLPFILFTAYRALIGENERHRKIAKITWPMWLYVAITGPVVYWMISRYY
jgi:putative membrane protein